MLVLLLSLALIGDAREAVTAPTREAVTLDQKITQDTRGVHWRDYRFLSFTDVVEPAKLVGRKQVTRFAVASLNRTTNDLDQVITEIDPLLWAINVQKLDWKPATWEAMSRDWVYYQSVPPLLKARLKAKTGSEAPIMRASVFVNDCWAAKWYTEFLGLPATRDVLFREHVIRHKNNNMVVGVVSESQVLVHPGKVVRFETPDQKAVWIRLNYKDNKGLNNSRRWPMNMHSQYNEIAIQMPNGLDMYAAYHALDDPDTMANMNDPAHKKQVNPDDYKLTFFGDTRVGVDHTAREQDGYAVQLGKSCISCHMEGPQRLNHIDTLATLHLPPVPAGQVWQAYQPETVKALVAKDRARWAAALKAINSLTPEQNSHEIGQVIDDYERELTLSGIAHQIGVSLSDLKARASRSRDSDISQMATAPETYRLSRTDFENLYPGLITLFAVDDQEYIKKRLR